jgi:hypothetical protein
MVGRALHQSRTPALAEVIGARRVRTAVMIFSDSISCGSMLVAGFGSRAARRAALLDVALRTDHGCPAALLVGDQMRGVGQAAH